MNPQERDLIADLFTRLRAADHPDKDPEADEFIRRAVAEVPAAPYLLTQTAIVHEHALKAAQARIADLEKQIADKPVEAPRRGFLDGLLGAPAAAPVRSRIPDYQPAPAPPPAYAQPAPSGGFLHNAMATAAGVAGGALLFEGIQRLMGHSSFASAGLMNSPWGGRPEEVVVNNYYDRDTQGRDQAADDLPQNDDDMSGSDAFTDDSGGGDSGGDF